MLSFNSKATMGSQPERKWLARPGWPAQTAVQSRTLHVETIRTAEGLAGLAPAWQRLERECATPLPFLTWEWVSSWWAHFHEDRNWIRDELAVRTINTSSGEIVGIAPLLLTERPSFGPLRARILDFIGPNVSAISEMGGILCHPSYEKDVYQALFDDLLRPGMDWSWIRWDGIPAASPALATHFGSRLRNAELVLGYELPLHGTWEEFIAARPREFRRIVRKGYAMFRGDRLEFQFEVARTPAEVRTALPDFFRLHRARAEMRGAVPHSDLFASGRQQHFLVDVCERLAVRDATRVFALRVGDDVVATRIGFVLGDSLYLYYSGWDPRYRPYRVMTTAQAEIIRYAIAARLRSVHLSFGRDRAKTNWRPREVRYLRGVQPATTHQGQLLWQASQWASGKYRGLLRGGSPGFLLRGAQPAST